jgi:hypothetical protein
MRIQESQLWPGLPRRRLPQRSVVHRGPNLCGFRQYVPKLNRARRSPAALAGQLGRMPRTNAAVLVDRAEPVGRAMHQAPGPQITLAVPHVGWVFQHLRGYPGMRAPQRRPRPAFRFAAAKSQRSRRLRRKLRNLPVRYLQHRPRQRTEVKMADGLHLVFAKSEQRLTPECDPTLRRAAQAFLEVALRLEQSGSHLQASRWVAFATMARASSTARQSGTKPAAGRGGRWL